MPINKEKKWKKRQISWLAIIALILGILLLVLLHLKEYEISYSAVVASTMEKSENIVKPDSFNNVVKPMLSNIAITLIVLGVGSLLLELYGYASYFRVRLAEVFTDDKIVNLLNSEYKKELKTNLTKSIYNPSTEDGDAILNLFDQKLANILETYYYSEYEISVKMEKIDDKYLKKTITRTTVINEINEKSKNYLTSFLSVSCKKIKEYPGKPFNLEYVKIGGNPIKDYHKEDQKNDLSHYDETYSFAFNKELEIKDNIEVEVQYTTIVPINDRNYTIRIDKLCKDFEIKFFFDDSEFEVGATGFKFTTTKKDSFKYKNYDGMTNARSNGWLLPGEGVVISIFEKC